MCTRHVTCLSRLFFTRDIIFKRGGGSGWRQCAQLSCFNKPNKPNWPGDKAAAAARAVAGVFAGAPKATEGVVVYKTDPRGTR